MQTTKMTTHSHSQTRPTLMAQGVHRSTNKTSLIPSIGGINVVLGHFEGTTFMAPTHIIMRNISN